MFSGIGGFELGIQRAFDNRPNLRNRTEGIPEDSPDTTQPQIRAECIGYSEIDKYAIKVYERQFNHGNHGNYRDATKIKPTDIPDFDLLVGGFPCQAFSVAGKRQGFDDTRGTLFFDIARILAEKRPGHLVLENVKGLLSHDKGRTFTTIIGVLTDLGYSVEWQVLNSKDFGVPQNRERIYIVGHLGNGCRRKVFPITGNNRQTIENIGYLNTPTWQKRNESIRRVYGTDGVAPTIPTGTGGGVMPKIVAQRGRDKGQQLEPRADDNTNTITSVAKDNYLTALPENKINRTVRSSGKSSTTNKHNWDTHLVGSRIRRLTPKECERLQGFPDDWTKLGVGDEPISDTQRYKMCGNAVTTNVVEAVMKGLLNELS